jgi:hypothetical protein
MFLFIFERSDTRQYFQLFYYGCISFAKSLLFLLSEDSSVGVLKNFEANDGWHEQGEVVQHFVFGAPSFVNLIFMKIILAKDVKLKFLVLKDDSG